MSYPWRVARFTVQERVGITISDLMNSKRKLMIHTARASTEFHEALATFCRGVSNMHRNNITHGDLHMGNITITQTTDNEFFSVKMIDFDRMQEHQPNSCDTCTYRSDLLKVLQCIMNIIQSVRCQSKDEDVKHNFASRNLCLRAIVSVMERTTRDMQKRILSATSADYLLELSEKCTKCPS